MQSIFTQQQTKNRLVFILLSLITTLLPLPASAGATIIGFSKIFAPDTIGPGAVSTLNFTISNTSGLPETDLAFTDNLPGSVFIATPANASTTCIDGEVTAPDGGASITFANGRIANGQSCSVSVDVTASTPGMYTNTAGPLTSSAGVSGFASDDLTVNTSLPGFSKNFAPSSVVLGGRSTLTFTIDNTLNSSPIPNLDFTDNLPTGMVVADPSNASTDCISASAPDTTLTAVAGTSSITLNADGSTLFPGLEVLPIGATCTVSVDVVSTGIGVLNNVSGDLLADFIASGKASATLNVTATQLALQKSFTNDPVPPGGTTTLEFTIDNFDRNFSATAIAFTDDLTTLVPALAGITFDSLLSNDCGGSVAGVGSTSINFSGGTLAAASSCTIRVSLAVPAGATPAAYTNTTSTISASINSSPVMGNMASDILFVEPVPVLTKEFLELGTLASDPIINAGDDVVLRFTITNTSTTSGATDIAFIDELTDNGPGTGFFPFPVSATLPPVPDPPCGAGSSLALIFIDTDRQGLSLTGGNLAADSSCSFEITLTAPADLAPALYLNTTEKITATVDGATRIGKPASDTLTVIAAPSLNKSFLDDPVAPGNTVSLEFTLSHSPNASSDATDISFTDDLAGLAIAGLSANLPATPDPPCGAGSSLTGSAGDTLLTLTGGNLTPGESCTFNITLDIPTGTASGSYTNTTSAVSATVEGLAATSVPASADLDVGGMVFTKEFLGDPAYPGKALTLRFALQNISSVTATGIGFTDSLIPVAGLIATDPALVDDCGGTLTVITIPVAGSFLTYAGGSLAPGQTCNIDVKVTVPATAADGIFQNVVSGVSYTLGTTPASDGPAIDDLTVDSNQLSLVKAFTDDPVAPGNDVTLEFTLTNLDADNPANNIAFSDDLDAVLTGLEATGATTNTCNGMATSAFPTGNFVYAGGSLAAGASCSIILTVSTPAGASAGIYPNTTSDLSGTIDGFSVTGDSASDSLEVIELLPFSKSLALLKFKWVDRIH